MRTPTPNRVTHAHLLSDRTNRLTTILVARGARRVLFHTGGRNAGFTATTLTPPISLTSLPNCADLLSPTFSEMAGMTSRVFPERFSILTRADAEDIPTLKMSKTIMTISTFMKSPFSLSINEHGLGRRLLPTTVVQ